MSQKILTYHVHLMSSLLAGSVIFRLYMEFVHHGGCRDNCYERVEEMCVAGGMGLFAV